MSQMNKVYESQPGLSKRETTSTNDSSTTSKCKPSSWLRGRPGRDGRDGRDGESGPVGRPGKDGKDGRDGQPGPVGPPGKNGLSAKQLENFLEKARKSMKLGLVGRKNSGAVYVRWGRTTCPPHSKLVYDGYAGGPLHTHKGGGSTKVCLSKTPEFRSIKSGFQSASYIYGAEYEVFYNPFSNKNTRGHALYEADVVCAVCLATSRLSHVMIPGKMSCPKGWTREYNGYLMSEHSTHYRSSYDCMDIAPEVRNGGFANKNGALFYVVEADCGYSLPCPPYKEGAELTCVVCTR